MGLLLRSIESFKQVRTAAKTDVWLNGAISFTGILPVYIFAGRVCNIHYTRYLDSRKKRLERASACSARLVLSIEKEKAEEDAWQIEFIGALAQELRVPETRLNIQEVGESHGDVFIRVLLSCATAPTDTKVKDPPCDVLWKRVSFGSNVTGPLSAVKRIIIDGTKESENPGKKVYSLWLVPRKKAKEECDKAIKGLSEKFEGPTFEPHVTLLGGVSFEQEEDATGIAERFARETKSIDIAFKKVFLGDTYFRSVVLEAEPSSELSMAHSRVRELLPKSYLPRALGGQSCQWLDTKTKTEGFFPHLSLAYTQKPPADAAVVEESYPTLCTDASFTARAVEVWQTDPEDRTCKSWSKVASFNLEGKKPASFTSLFLRFSRVAAPEFFEIALGTVLSLAGSIICDKACQHDMSLYSGSHAGKSNQELFQILCRGLMLWGTFSQLCDWSGRIIEKAGKKIGLRLKGELYDSLLNQDVKWIQKKGADELYKTLMQRSDNVERMFTQEIPGVIRMFSDVIINIGLLWFSKPRLCAFGFGLFAFQNINGGIFDTILRVAKDFDEKVEAVKENTLEVLQNFRIVRAFVREGKEKEAFRKSLQQDLNVKRSDIVGKFTDIGSWFGFEFTFQLAYMYGGILVNIGDILASEVREAVQKTFKSIWPLYQVRYKLTNKSTFVEDAEAVLEALERPPDIPFEDESKYNPEPHKVRGEIELDSVRFSYTDDVDDHALNNVSFKIPAGSMVGLVGPSGCGKSTLFNLLLRFYDPQAGSVKVDGIDLANWNPQALYRSVAWVSQDQAVFGGTILDNIRYGVPDATEMDVLRVMKEAALYDDVMKKEKGVSTMASELSGGQKQRLSIARALLRDPKILFLDEATSALDTASERKVQKAFETLMKGRTVIAIAHRLSTIMNSDLILVMEAGKLIEQGTHTDLLKKNDGKYASLVHQQLAVDDDNAKAETPKDPKDVEESLQKLNGLRARVPAEFREEVDDAIECLKSAVKTLQKEKSRLAMKERSLIGAKPWRGATHKIRTAMQAVRRMQMLSAGKKTGEDGSPSGNHERRLERALSKAKELEDEPDDIPHQPSGLVRNASAP